MDKVPPDLTKDEVVFLRFCIKAHLDFYTQLVGTGEGSKKSRTRLEEISQLDEKLRRFIDLPPAGGGE